MSDSEQRDNQLDRLRQQARKGYGGSAREAVRQNLGLTGQCPVCTENPAKPSISLEHGGQKYMFCSTECRGKFDNAHQ